MKTENILLTIFITTYITAFLLFLKEACKMHKNNDSDDPFYGSHIVVVLCFIGLIPIVNIIIGLFLSAITFLKYLKGRDVKRLEHYSDKR